MTPLEALDESTSELVRAAQAGDMARAEAALRTREGQLAALRATPLESQQLQKLILRGHDAVRLLRSRRETLRSLIGEADALRRRLDAWAPQAVAEGRLDLQA